jgi:hypothetical protein
MGSQFLAPDLSLVQSPKASSKHHVSAVPQAQLVEVTSGDSVKPRKSISKKEVECTCCIYSRIMHETDFNIIVVETQESQQYFSMLFTQRCIMHVADLDPMWCKQPSEDNATKHLLIHKTLQKDITKLMVSIENNPHAAAKLWIVAVVCPTGMTTSSLTALALKLLTTQTKHTFTAQRDAILGNKLPLQKKMATFHQAGFPIIVLGGNHRWMAYNLLRTKYYNNKAKVKELMLNSVLAVVYWWPDLSKNSITEM